MNAPNSICPFTHLRKCNLDLKFSLSVILGTGAAVAVTFRSAIVCDFRLTIMPAN